MNPGEFTKRGPVQTQMAQIMEVIPSQRRITGVLKDGGRVDVAVLTAGPSFQWPKVGELWRLRYDQGFWTLDSRVELPATPNAVNINDLNAGETRIAGDVVHTDGHLTVNGNVTGSGSATFSGAFTAGSLTINSATNVTIGGYAVARKFSATLSGLSPITVTHNLNDLAVSVAMAVTDASNFSHGNTVLNANQVQATYTNNTTGANSFFPSGSSIVIFG